MKTPYNPEKNLVTLANTLLKHYGITPFHSVIPSLSERLKNHTKVVCLLFDGMGKAIVDRHLEAQAFLQHHRFDTITSTFPSTTAAATNAFLSGKYPGEIGWLGWSHYFKEHNRLIELFTGQDYFSQTPFLDPLNIREMLPYISIFDAIQIAHPHMHVGHVWPAIRPDGAKTLSEFEAQIDTQLIQPEVLLYGYWLDPDKSIHIQGVGHPNIHTIIQDIDAMMAHLHEKHPDTLFLVFADHGLVDVHFTPVNEHDDFYACLERSFALEPRAAAFYVKRDKKEEFERLFTRYYGKDFTLVSREKVKASHLYGEGSYHPRFDDFIGDYVAISHGPLSFSHGVPIGQKPLNFVAHHAGIHPDEMLIQLFVID